MAKNAPIFTLFNQNFWGSTVFQSVRYSNVHGGLSGFQWNYFENKKKLKNNFFNSKKTKQNKCIKKFSNFFFKSVTKDFKNRPFGFYFKKIRKKIQNICMQDF